MGAAAHHPSTYLKSKPICESQWAGGAEWLPLEGWVLRAEAGGAHHRYALNDLNNIFKAEDYWTADLELRRTLPQGEIFVKLNNLFDEEYSAFTTSDAISVVNLNPSPGFNVEAGVRIEI